MQSSDIILNRDFDNEYDKILWYNAGSGLICTELRPASGNFDIPANMDNPPTGTIRQWYAEVGKSMTPDLNRTEVIFALRKNTNTGFNYS